MNRLLVWNYYQLISSPNHPRSLWMDIFLFENLFLNLVILRLNITQSMTFYYLFANSRPFRRTLSLRYNWIKKIDARLIVSSFLTPSGFSSESSLFLNIVTVLYACILFFVFFYFFSNGFYFPTWTILDTLLMAN